MQNNQLHHRIRQLPLGVIAAFSAVMLVAGGGTAWWTWNTLTSVPTSEQPDTLNPGNDSTTAPSEDFAQEPPTAPATVAETDARLYLLEVTDTSFELVPAPIQVEDARDPEVVLTAAFDQLLAEPDESLGFSEIPDSTTLLDLKVQPDGVYVDLSANFEQGGGSASMMGRLGQVVYTATSLDTDGVVFISVGGVPLEYLGGEGLIVDQPMTRETFDQNFPL
ncbi:MAG: GerMN domain-containing protein [Elainellaceae cyanobacterium]